jgi:hypothetical protein
MRRLTATREMSASRDESVVVLVKLIAHANQRQSR